MADLFVITNEDDKLTAETGSAKTVFKITNKTLRPLRGFVTINPRGNTEAAWLKIEGEVERDFPASESHYFTINFTKPKPTVLPHPAEIFEFGLNASSSVNPDEDSTKGPTVKVEIPEQKKEKKRWWIVAIAAAILLIVGGVVLFLVLRNGGDDVAVPDVTNKTFTDAEAELANKSFKAEKVEEIAPQRSPDVVFKQDPEAETKAETNSTVKLSVPAMTTVPPLKGLTLNDAIKKLKAGGLKIGTITGDGDAIKDGNLNQVSSQNPLANTPALKDSEVSISFPCVATVSKPCRKIANIKDFKEHIVNPEIIESLQKANPKFNSAP